MIHAQTNAACREPARKHMEPYVNDQGERVTARQVTQDSITVISVWCHGQTVVEHDALDHEMTFPALNVPTSDGPKRASQGDYIVRYDDGSFDVKKAYEFRSKFREV
jgi:hypothetical protein